MILQAVAELGEILQHLHQVIASAPPRFQGYKMPSLRGGAVVPVVPRGLPKSTEAFKEGQHERTM